MKNLFSTSLFALLCLLLTCCGKDANSPGSCNAALFSDEVNPALAEWQDAATAFGSDPTPANCAEYKSKGRAWLDAISGYENCSLIYSASLREAVEEAKAELEAEPCN